MEKLNKFLLMMISMVAIMLAAVGIDRGIRYYDARKWDEERAERYRQTYADAADIRMTISQLAEDQEAIEAFIEENREYFDEVVDAGWQASFPYEEQRDLPADETEAAVSGDAVDISGNGLDGVSANGIKTISGNGMDISGNELRDVSGNLVSGNELRDASGNMLTDISGNTAGQFPAKGPAADSTLLEKRKIRASYMETQMQNDRDLQVIENSSVDFSDISIACLGDSITQAANLDDMEDYQQYAYPARLGELLEAESVTNLGIGGSSIGRYWDQPFVDRFKEIPEDTDLIIVMGGTNDGFCLSQEELGTMEERAANTFIGDLDELMRGLKENYPDAAIVFATPLPNVLHDMLRKERDYLLPQTVIVNVIKKLAEEYEIPVIDLYNSNILDTHDAAVIYNYMPDGVHCNPAGYSLLAEHFAAELIGLYEGEEAWDTDRDEGEEADTDVDEEEEQEEQEEQGADEDGGLLRDDENVRTRGDTDGQKAGMRNEDAGE